MGATTDRCEVEEVCHVAGLWSRVVGVLLWAPDQLPDGPGLVLPPEPPLGVLVYGDVVPRVLHRGSLEVAHEVGGVCRGPGGRVARAHSLVELV